MTRGAFLLLFFLHSVSVAAQGAALSGIVRDPDGRPVAGATVIVQSVASAPVSVRSDADGRFQFDALGEGRFDVAASAPGLTGDFLVRVDVPLMRLRHDLGRDLGARRRLVPPRAGGPVADELLVVRLL